MKSRLVLTAPTINRRRSEAAPVAPRPVTAWASTYRFRVAERAVCPGHVAPLDFVTDWVEGRPPLSVVLGPRGGGKSWLSAFATHLDSVHRPRHGTAILGGSLAQSRQIYNALREFYRITPGRFAAFKRESAEYANGSEVAVLAASPTSVRGPHVPTLRLDEIDEMTTDIRESALGMCMEVDGVSASVSMTSTWHRLGGPMADLLDRGDAGEFPTYRFCAFEVLEACPESRSGPNLERCPECPIVRWCHDVPDGVTPKAKRSDGHYAIDSLIQKVRGVSTRVFEADYMCLGPKADGVWFGGFDPGRHVAEAAEYDPAREAYLAADVGVVTGAVLFQCWPESPGVHRVAVFADYLSEGQSAESNARAILELIRTRCEGKVAAAYCDPAGGARNPVGPTVIGAYAAAGLHLRPWSAANPSVADSLERLEGLLCPADGAPRLTLHPRCRATIAALTAYRRARRGGQWQDYPEDPQHPHEDLVDALRGGLHARLGRATFRTF